MDDFKNTTVEECTREDSIADSPGLCYHCDNSIPVGSEVTVLRTSQGGYYRMHKACADIGWMEVRKNARP